MRTGGGGTEGGEGEEAPVTLETVAEPYLVTMG